jgi:ketosteroid isomerase-like protein
VANIDIMRDFLDSFFKGDLDAASTFLADDFKVVESEGMPYAGEWLGRDGFRRLVEAVNACWADMKIALTDIIGDPDGSTFAVLMNMDGKSARNGRSFSTSLCELWSVRNGKITLVRPFYWDTKLMSGLSSG